MKSLNKELRESGEFVFAEGLSFPDQAKAEETVEDGQGMRELFRIPRTIVIK